MAEINNFKQFVDDMEVVDVPVLGKKISWFSHDGLSMSRLDRFLLTDGFIGKSGITGQWIGDRDISDHCPVWTLCSQNNWGPKPFRVVNGWLEHPDFKEFVSYNVQGKKAFVLKEKLKLLKESLKIWNKEVFGILDLNIEKTVKDINDFEGLLENNDGDFDYLKREGLNKDFWNQLNYKDNLLKQKSRTKWLKEGDSNSRFFHQSIKGRRRRNQLVALRDGDHWVQGVDEIKKFVKHFFVNNFTEEWSNRPHLDGISFPTLSLNDNLFLLAPFSVDEVRDVVWNSDGNKCPGPDGFNFNFLKACWDTLKGDIMDFVHDFHSNAILPKAITASFLALIPKKDNPQTLYDYRPICLVGSLYKIISKVLATRLKKVLGNLISKCQSAFLPNRQILDGVLVVNELIDLAKRKKDKCLLLKVDFERAYDTVNWDYLSFMMKRMGFSQGWMKWMRACVFNSSMSVLVNGSPTEDFSVSKGLRQGDPLSPFLFLIAAEGLARLMQKAVDIGSFHSYKVSDALQFHTLQFADDTIMIGEGNWDNLWTLKTVLRSFELVSGLKVNFFKSKLYGINLEDSFLEAASSFLFCEVDSIPFRFLGIPVGANPRRKITVTLINSVLSSLPLYFFSFFKAPVCVLKELVNIQRKFLWGGSSENKKICWVSWDTICLPKEKGGLGIKNLNLFNQALLSKWKWRGICEPNSSWSKLLAYRYGSLYSNFLDQVVCEGRGQSIWWRDLLKIGRDDNGDWFRSNISNVLGQGNAIRFWKDKWYGPDCLMDLYPALYFKTSMPNCFVADTGFEHNGKWIWNICWAETLSSTESDEAEELLYLLADISPKQDKLDSMRWIPDHSGNFSVNSAYQFLLNSVESNIVDENVVHALNQLWVNDVPSKVNVFGWRLLLVRLPTRLALVRKGIIVNHREWCCAFCYREKEDINHLFFNCSFSIRVWTNIFKWMKVTYIHFEEVWSHFNSFGALVKNNKNAKGRHLIWLATTWSLWRARNNTMFRGVVANVSVIVDQIIFITWFWFIGRIGNNSCYKFSDWCIDPLACLHSI
ncbi:unnamed protein product [Trifolium pratense]|uniref:Uncharacterized protein n=1 Tax=Trifolium pratense TaxID=57577 RepID=A0ACB0IGC4_TRIPR|nr:unnamed protein product [Trifolium pratense]